MSEILQWGLGQASKLRWVHPGQTLFHLKWASAVNFSFQLLGNMGRRGWKTKSGNPYQQLTNFSLTHSSWLSCPQLLLTPNYFTSTLLQTQKCCYKACANSHQVSLLTIMHLSGSVCRHVESPLTMQQLFTLQKKNLQLWFCNREDEEIPLIYSILGSYKYHIRYYKAYTNIVPNVIIVWNTLWSSDFSIIHNSGIQICVCNNIVCMTEKKLFHFCLDSSEDEHQRKAVGVGKRNGEWETSPPLLAVVTSYFS